MKNNKAEIERFLKELSAWQKETFPQSTSMSMLEHLSEEIQELLDGIATDPRSKNTKYEFADCFILLFGSAMRYGMDLDCIINVMKDKFHLVQQRKWGQPDEKNVYRHIKPK